MRHRLSISLILALLFGLLALLGQFVSYRVSSEVLNEAIRLREIDKITTLGNVIKGRISDYGNQALLVARLLAAINDVTGAIALEGSERRTVLAANLDEAFRSSHIRTLEVTDANETVVYRAHDPEQHGDQASGWGVAEVLSGTGMLVSTRGREGVFIQAIEPLRINNVIVGTISAGVTLSRAFIDNLNNDIGIKSILLGRQGVAVSGVSAAPSRVDAKAIIEAFEKKVPIYRIDTVAHHTSVYLPFLIVDEAYVVLAELDSRLAYKLVDEGTRRSAVSGILILVSSIGIGLLALRVVMNPLRKLRARAQQTAIDLTGEMIYVPGNNEVAAVVKVLDTLTNRLVQRNQDLIAAMTSADLANRAKSQFLSTMSHEIRTPLNGVLGVTELLQRTHLDSEQTRFVEAIASAGHTLLSLLGDILDLAKIEEGKVQLELVDFDFKKLLADITNVYHAMATARDLLIVTNLDDLPQDWVRGDPTRLRQVLSNLLGNAVKFTARGEVRLRVEHLPSSVDDPRPWWRFTIEDTGIGITPEAVDKLFQRFSQADASTTRQFGGTGLGLAICRHLVELMDGHIHVSSVPGKGSCFQVDVPLEAALLPHVQEPKVSLAPISTGAKILVAEDNAVNQLVIRSLLSRLGAVVTVVENGEKAVNQMRQETFDLVFMDCQMPVMDGFEATQRMRTWERSNSGRHAIPIIALTANALAGDREICIAAGMTDYITKPVTAAGLSKILEHHLPGNLQPADALGANTGAPGSALART